MYQNDPMKVLTGEVRLSYANLTTPRAAQQGGEPKYSVTLLIPKTDVWQPRLTLMPPSTPPQTRR